MTAKLIEPCDESYSEPDNSARFFQGKKSTLDDLQKREAIPIGKPGLSCQNNLFLGFFFDGTRNNYATSFKKKDNTFSNVARLFDAFPGQIIAPKDVKASAEPWPNESSYPNYMRIYTPGVGTPFDEVRDTGQGLDATMGAAMAKWGERRLMWALCQAINAVHLYLKKEVFIKPSRVSELIQDLELDGRQLGARRPVFIDLGRAANTKAHLVKLLLQWHQAIRGHMPQAVTGQPPKVDPGILQHIYVSAFGFSRGATAARAYTNWFLALCQLDAELTKQSGYTLGGIPVTFDFLGIFDTVASVGTASITPGNLGSGHMAWADAERSLRVPADVRCLHIVSAHEVRRCFPLDAISVNGQLGSAHLEIIMPGVHSDIGGGYSPMEQGRGHDPQGGDMLSRIALAIMYKEARLSGAPLKLERASPVAKERFKVHPDVINALNNYIDACAVKQGSFRDIMRDQMKMAILWRKGWAGKMGSLANVKRASQVDINDIVSADDEFLAEIAAFERWRARPTRTETVQVCPRPEMGVCVDMEEKTVSTLPGIDPERLQDWAHIAAFWSAGRPASAIAHLLENHVHDSRAWFKLLGTEAADVETELKKWVRAYDQHQALQRNTMALALAGGYAPNPLNAQKIKWVEDYKKTGKIPAMKTEGREPFELGAGYLRFRRVYSGADAWRLTQSSPLSEKVGVDSALASTTDSRLVS